VFIKADLQMSFKKIAESKTFNETFNDFFNNRVCGRCVAGMCRVKLDRI